MGIGKKIKKSILLYTAVFAVFFILVSVVLDYYGLKFLDWVIYLSGGFVAIGVIGGTIQILVHAGRKKRGLPLAISIVFLVLEITASLLAATGIFLLADRQEVTERDGRIMVKETHSFLFSNWIAYYDYRNPFVMGKQVRIYEAYDDSLAEYLDTYYFDEEGNSLRKAFLKAPLDFFRITSRFTNARFHPILKRYRAHHGVDYAAPTGTPVHSIGDGTVIATYFTAEEGYVIEVQHNNNYISIYRCNDRLLKSVGQKVSEGENIAISGNLIEGKIRPYVEFQLWHQGVPLNPSEYIHF